MLNEHVTKRARTISWQEALQDIEREHGLSTAEWRRVVADRAKIFAVRVLLAFGRSTPIEKHMMAKGFDRFTNNMKKAADDPDLVPKLEFLFHDHAADFLDEITEGIHDHYLCRRKGCNFVGPNAHWIISSTGGQFRCPDCGERYQPWRSIEDKTHDTFIPAQKILIFSRLDTTTIKNNEGGFLKGGLFKASSSGFFKNLFKHKATKADVVAIFKTAGMSDTEANSALKRVKDASKNHGISGLSATSVRSQVEKFAAKQ
jgi:hypothetical protein